MNLTTPFLEHVRQRPDAPAIIAMQRGRERCITYAGLDDLSARAASLLKSAGLRRGDTVLVWVPVGIELYVLLIALFRMGAVAMIADPGAGPRHLDHCARIGRPVLAAGTPLALLWRWRSRGLRSIPRTLCVGGRFPCAISWKSIPATPPDPAIEPLPDDAPALLTFTSGSTGLPKAALRTHGFLLAQHAAIEHALALRPGETDLATLPIFVLANLASGLTTLLPDGDLRRPGRMAPDPIWRQIERHRPVRSTASPAFFRRLASTGRTWDSCRQLHTGGGPVFPSDIEAFARLAPKASVNVLYGSTEAEPISEIAHADISPADLDAMRAGRGLLVGPPTRATALRIIRDQYGTPMPTSTPAALDADTLPPGEPGEIIVSGPQVLRGYVDGQGDADNKIHCDGTTWHRTGDTGYLDTRGRLWLLGRCSATVRRPGHPDLHPFCIETAARAVPGVASAALASPPSGPVIAIQTSPGAPHDWHDRLAARLTPIAPGIPIVPLDRIPLDKRHDAKVDHPALLKILAERRNTPKDCSKPAK